MARWASVGRLHINLCEEIIKGLFLLISKLFILAMKKTQPTHTIATNWTDTHAHTYLHRIRNTYLQSQHIRHHSKVKLLIWTERKTKKCVSQATHSHTIPTWAGVTFYISRGWRWKGGQWLNDMISVSFICNLNHRMSLCTRKSKRGHLQSQKVCFWRNWPIFT